MHSLRGRLELSRHATFFTRIHFLFVARRGWRRYIDGMIEAFNPALVLDRAYERLSPRLHQ